MANRKDDLILYLKLDDINTDDNTVPDSSQSKNVGKAQGASLVPDDIFGACMSFDGTDDEVEVSDAGLTGANPAHTIEAWIRVDEYPQARAWILLLGQKGSGSHHWLLNTETAGDDLAKKTQLGVWGSAQFYPEIPLGQWVHLATTYADGKLNAYVNGETIDQPKAATFNFTEKQLTLAGKGLSNEQNFKGKIACLRLYRRALTAAEIKEDMDADKMALPAYRGAHPIAFSLYDENENYVLYIDDDPNDEQRLILELRNTSARAISFIKNDDHASQDNYHFELVFRGGTLSEKTIKILRENSSGILQGTETGNWDIYSPGEDKQSRTISLYFLKKDTSENFGPDQHLLILLQNISAAAGTGARGTRIELRLHQLTYVDDTAPITGSRVQHQQIINHLGSRRIPLHVGFVGSHRILNDGDSANTLVLQLMNVLRSEQDTTITLTPDTEFLISFDVQSEGEVAPWSLCTEEEIKSLETDDSIIVAKIDNDNNVLFSDGKPVSDTEQWNVTPPTTEDKSHIWTLSPKTNLVLKRDDYIQVYISNIKTSLPYGLTNLYLDYKNIPGFWDGQVICTIEKAPLLFHPGVDSKGNPERHVGINTLNPKNTLDVKGTVVIGKTYAGNNRAPDGTDLLVEGKVGIGATSPAAKLAVMGGVNIGGTADPGNNNLYVDGNVGIGKMNPLFKVHVSAPGGFGAENPDGIAQAGNVPLVLQSDSTVFGILNASGRQAFAINIEGDASKIDARGIPTFSDKFDGRWHRALSLQNGNVGIGTYQPQAKLQIIDIPQDANGNTLILGPTDASNLRLGYHNDYSWIQSHWSKPLLINPLSNNVGIGATAPEAKLDVNGDMIVKGVIKGKYSGQGITGKIFVSETDPSKYATLTDRRTSFALERLLDQQAAIIQGFSTTTAASEPHQFAIGYRGDGSKPNNAIILDLTTGAMSGIHKSFVIQNPLHQDKYLMHATLEGPEGAVYYRGTARLRDGRAEIRLPDYFESLTHLEERTILLTNLDGFDQLAVLKQDGAKIKNGVFIVISSNKESSQEFDWEAKAVRKDVEKLEVEPLKGAVTVERFGPYAYAMPKKGSKAE